ncbi:ankyrin repeat domain-containing protein [Streptomyces sp. bgisy095]|uniref:ankyrin repeat domain-containing protein n=1 Tax=unclassified Streptomyces TaxID=2593676 RepID=UPI003D74ABE8
MESPWTPAHQAVESFDYEALTRLLDAGADPDEVCCGETLLDHAVDLEGDGALQSGKAFNAAATAILLAYGADPGLESPAGGTPLETARKYGHTMAERLIERYLEIRRG